MAGSESVKVVPFAEVSSGIWFVASHAGNKALISKTNNSLPIKEHENPVLWINTTLPMKEHYKWKGFAGHGF